MRFDRTSETPRSIEEAMTRAEETVFMVKADLASLEDARALYTIQDEPWRVVATVRRGVRGHAVWLGFDLEDVRWGGNRTLVLRRVLSQLLRGEEEE
jgi:hypothetical protein